MSLNRLPLTKALRTMVENATGKPCGLASIPTSGSPATPVDPPYSILYPIAGSRYSGPPLDDSNADAEWVYQLTAVADRADQAEWLTDKIRAAVLGWTDGAWDNALTVTGMTVIGRSHAGDGGVDPAGTVVSSAERFVFSVTKA